MLDTAQRIPATPTVDGDLGRALPSFSPFFGLMSSGGGQSDALDPEGWRRAGGSVGNGRLTLLHQKAVRSASDDQWSEATP